MSRYIYLFTLLVVTVSPWAIGGNWPFTRTFLLLNCFGLMILGGINLFTIRQTHSRPAKTPLIWCLLVLGIGLTVFQSSQLSSSFVQKYGSEQLFRTGDPTAVTGVRTEASQSEKSASSLPPISVNPAATRERLVDLIYAVGLFLAASLLLVERRRITTLLIALTVSGVGISFLGIIQKLSGERKIYWTYELLWGGSPFSTFVNCNSAAGFLTICYSAGIFFLAQQIYSVKKRQRDLPLAAGKSSSRTKAAPSRFVEMVARAQPTHLYFPVAIAVILAGILACLSRGGMLAIGTAMVVTVVLFFRAHRSAAIALTGVLLAFVTVFVTFSGFLSSITGEIQSLSDLATAAAPRLNHWRNAIPFGIENGILGSGNGTYRYVSPLFQTGNFLNNFAHAECVYIETLVEMGWIGVVLLLTTVGYCVFAAMNLLSRAHHFDRSLGIAGLSCIAGQIVACAFDFGIYQPANSTAMAVMMGAVVGRYRNIDTSQSPPIPAAPGPHRQTLKKLIFAFVGIAMVWAIYESYGIELRKSAARSIALYKNYSKVGVRLTRKVSLEAVQQQLEQSTILRPDDSEAHSLLGELAIIRYRREQVVRIEEILSQEKDRIKQLGLPEDEQDAMEKELQKMDAQTIWNSTSTAFLHEQIRKSERNNPVLADELKLQKGTEFLREAYGHFEAAHQAMPRLAKTQLKLAQLVAITSLQNAGDSLVEERNYLNQALACGNPSNRLLFSCGLLALNSGDQEMAVDVWRTCLERPFTSSYRAVIVDYCLRELSMRQFFEQVLPQEPRVMLDVARKQMSAPELALPRTLLINRVRQVISQTKMEEIQRLLFLAESAKLIDDYPTAADEYRKALELAPSEVPWRYDYAYCLFQTKQFDEALRQLKKCELDPTVPIARIKSLLRRIATAR